MLINNKLIHSAAWNTIKGVVVVIATSAVITPIASAADGARQEPIWSCPYEKDPEGSLLMHGQEITSLSKIIDIFKGADANKDGKVTLAEAALYPSLLPDFGNIDANKDKVVTPLEVANFIDSGLRKQVKEIVRNADRNDDGYLDKKEALAYRIFSENFDKLDSDNSGTVSVDEIVAALKR